MKFGENVDSRALSVMIAMLALSMPAWSFNTVTVAKVAYIDEWDTGFTRI